MPRARAPTLSQTTISTREAAEWGVTCTSPSHAQEEEPDRMEAHLGSVDFNEIEKARAKVVLYRSEGQEPKTKEEEEMDQVAIQTFTNGPPITTLVGFLRACYTTYHGKSIQDWMDRIVAIPAIQFGRPWAGEHGLSDNTMLLACMLEKPERYSTNKGCKERFGAFYVFLDRQISTASAGTGQFFKVVGDELRQTMHNSRLTLPYHRDEPYAGYHVGYTVEREKEWLTSNIDAIESAFASRQQEDYRRSKGVGEGEGGEQGGLEGEHSAHVIQAVACSPHDQVIMASPADGSAEGGAQPTADGAGASPPGPTAPGRASTTGAPTGSNQDNRAQANADAADQFMIGLSENSYSYDLLLPDLHNLPEHDQGRSCRDEAGSEGEASGDGSAELADYSGTDMPTLEGLKESLFNHNGTPLDFGPTLLSQGKAEETPHHTTAPCTAPAEEKQLFVKVGACRARTRLVRQPTRRGYGKNKGASLTKAQRRLKPRQKKPEATITKKVRAREAAIIKKAREAAIAKKAQEMAKNHRQRVDDEYVDSPPWTQDEHDKVAGAVMSSMPAGPPTAYTMTYTANKEGSGSARSQSPEPSQGSTSDTFSTQSGSSGGGGEFDPASYDNVSLVSDEYVNNDNVHYSAHQLKYNRVTTLRGEFVTMKEARTDDGRTTPSPGANSKHIMRFGGVTLYLPIYGTGTGSTVAEVRAENYNQPHITFYDTNPRTITKNALVNSFNYTVPHTVNTHGHLHVIEFVKLQCEEGGLTNNVVFDVGATAGERLRNRKQIQAVFKQHSESIAALPYLGKKNTPPVAIYGQHDDQRLVLKLAFMPEADWRCGHDPMMVAYAMRAIDAKFANQHFTVEARTVLAKALKDTGTQEDDRKIKCIVNAISFYGFKHADNLVTYLEHHFPKETESVFARTPLMSKLNRKDYRTLAAQIWAWGRMRHEIDYPFTQYPRTDTASAVANAYYAGEGAGAAATQESETWNLTSCYSSEGQMSESSSAEGQEAGKTGSTHHAAQQARKRQQPPSPAYSPPPSPESPSYSPPSPPYSMPALPSAQPSSDKVRSPDHLKGEDENRGRARYEQREQRTKHEGGSEAGQPHRQKGRWGREGADTVNELHVMLDEQPTVDVRAQRQAHVMMNDLLDGYGVFDLEDMLQDIRQKVMDTYRLRNSLAAGGAPGGGKTTLIKNLADFAHDIMGLEDQDTQTKLEDWVAFAPELEEYSECAVPDTIRLQALQTAVLNGWIANKPHLIENCTTFMDRCAWDAVPFVLQGLRRGTITFSQAGALFTRFMKQTCLPQLHVFVECSRHTALTRLEARTQAGDRGFTHDSLGEITAWHLVWAAMLRLWTGGERVRTVRNDGAAHHAATAVVGMLNTAAYTLQGMQGTRDVSARRMGQRGLGAGAGEPDTTAGGGRYEEGGSKWVRFHVSLANFDKQGEHYRTQFDIDILPQDSAGTIVNKICAAIIHDSGKPASNDVGSYACYAEQGAYVGREVPINSALEPREVNSYTIIKKETAEYTTINSEQLKRILGMLQQKAAAQTGSTPHNNDKGAQEHGTCEEGDTASNLRGLRLRKDAPSLLSFSKPLGVRGVPSADAQSTLLNNTDPEFIRQTLGSAGDVADLPADMIEDPAASRHCTLQGTPLHPDCPRPIKDIPGDSVVYVEYFGQQTTEIDDLLNDNEDFTVGANGALVQQGKKLKPFRALGEYMEAADNMDLWMVNTGRHTQAESLAHRCFVRGIRELCELYTWDAVLKYDHTFRALKAAKAIKAWNEHRPELTCKLLLPGLKSARPRQQQARPQKRKARARASGQGTEDEPARKRAKTGGGGGAKKRKQPCRRYNSAAGCTMTPGDGPGECWYAHQCSVQGCKKAHGAHEHQK